MNYKNSKAFTLVELIVVITILAVLATIAFISMQGFALNARESTRASDISTMMRAFDYFKLKEGSYPIPQNATIITASGGVVGYQVDATRDILGKIRYSEEAVDPLDKTPYSYYVLADGTAIQMMALMENSESLRSYLPVRTAHADFSSRFPKTFGKKLGILTTPLNVPVQDSIGTGSVDLTQTTASYTAHLGDQYKVSGSGAELRQSVPRASCKRIYDMNEGGLNGYYTIYPIDETPVEVYCNMEDEGGGLTLIARSVDDISFNGTPFGWFISRGTPQDDSQPYSLGSMVQDIPFEKVYLSVYDNGKTMTGGVTVLDLNDIDLFDITNHENNIPVTSCTGVDLGGGVNSCLLFSNWGNFSSQESYFFSPAPVGISGIADLSDLSLYSGNQRDGLNRRRYGGSFPFPGMIFVK